MTKEEYLLTCLQEECNETGQRAAKAVRFGLEEVQPDNNQLLTNAQRLVYEFNDLLAVMEVMQSEGIIDNIYDRDAVALKKIKIQDWFRYAKKEAGTIDRGEYLENDYSSPLADSGRYMENPDLPKGFSM